MRVEQSVMLSRVKVDVTTRVNPASVVPGSVTGGTVIEVPAPEKVTVPAPDGPVVADGSVFAEGPVFADGPTMVD